MDNAESVREAKAGFGVAGEVVFLKGVTGDKLLQRNGYRL